MLNTALTEYLLHGLPPVRPRLNIVEYKW